MEKKLRFEESTYVRKLMISDHIREINILYDKYKLKETTWDDVRRELCDLYIMLFTEFDDRKKENQELVDARMKKFWQKQNEEI